MFLCAVGCGFLMFAVAGDQDAAPLSALHVALSKVAPKTIALCDVKSTWSKATKQDLVFHHKNALKSSLKGGLTCGAFSEPLCASSTKGELVCRCEADLKHLKRTPLYPAQKRQSKSKTAYGDVLAYWSSKDASPKWFVLDEVLTPNHKDLHVLSHDLNGDGHQEVLIAVDGVYNTIGRRWINTVVFDSKRPGVAHLHETLGPEVFDHQKHLKRSHCKTKSCDAWRHKIQSVLIRKPGQVDGRQCALMSMSISTEGNACNGCTAGGPTHATYEAKVYKKSGKWVVLPRRRLW